MPLKCQTRIIGLSCGVGVRVFQRWRCSRRRYITNRSPFPACLTESIKSYVNSTLFDSRAHKFHSWSSPSLRLPAPIPSERARNDERFRTTSEFLSVYGIGPVLANKLYYEGHRSLGDLKARYKNSNINAGIGGAQFPMEEALKLRDELQIK